MKRLISYNIHKGFNFFKTKYVLNEIKFLMRKWQPDFVLLQEVLGYQPHKIDQKEFENQFEHIADEVWQHFAYGKNAVYEKGHHGNAILSKFPIKYHTNKDISESRFAKRGALQVTVECPETNCELDLVCVHLDLFPNQQKRQIKQIHDQILNLNAGDRPIILGGDFNDWRNFSTRMLQTLGFQDSFCGLEAAASKTFPSIFPTFSLDRIYTRGIQVTNCRVLRDSKLIQLSDHLPILIEFDWDLR